MAREINPNLVPPGGRKFIEQDGSQHYGQSWEHLVKVVEAYRLRAGYPVGDVKEEIENQVCGGSPELCREVPDGPRTKPGWPFNTKIVSWLAWAVGRKRVNEWHQVSDEEALRRAAICQSCPKQRPLNQTCGQCLLDVAAAREALGPSPHRNLHPCSVLHEDCASSVHADLPPSNNPELPAGCWRRG